jgi:hypothetical protein
MSLFAWAGCQQRSVPTEHNDAPQQMPRDTLYQLDEKNKTLSQVVDENAASASYGHVKVEVVKVINPEKHPVSFDVYYQSGRSEKTLLGTFSLYPNDHTGRFIVATQGKVTTPGTLILELKIAPTARNIQIATTPMTLIK